MRSPRFAALIAIFAIALVSCTKSADSGAKSPPAERHCTGATLEIGDALPADCTVTTTDGASLTLEQVRAGKPAVLNFWASWCVYCIKEMPDFQRAFERAGGRISFVGLDLLGVQGETKQAASSLAAKTGARYPLAYDQDGVFYHRVCPCGGRTLMPASVFVRADGTIAYLKFGPLNASELVQLIRTHLGTEI